MLKKLSFSFLAFMILSSLVIVSCKKEDKPAPKITFSEASGTAVAGEYNLTGNIRSDIKLQKVVVSVEGQSTPIITDSDEALDKLDYNYSYLITNISTDIHLIIDAYDQQGGRSTSNFFIKVQ